MKIGGLRAEEARVHDTWAGYHSFHNEEGEEYGSFEIFFEEPTRFRDERDEDTREPGWYWWACFPGCLPDGEPNGPFATSRDALEDADPWHPEFDEEDE